SIHSTVRFTPADTIDTGGGDKIFLAMLAAGPTSTGQEDTDEPEDPYCPAFILYQNYPNPFNPLTTIRFSLAEKCPVILRVYDVEGRLISTLANREYNAGSHSATWNGANKNGRSVSSGFYFYRIKAGKNIDSNKMLLLR
ncbi:MAG TPA: FlgD immunoglobulin-like domain containing protein, partial [Candidatus Krumholzibacteriaceae bacterium]|nr:FlgD immunoglobulin-like domain containing protein [Candidatus Krumholzibacteriaceae bacterium]